MCFRIEAQPTAEGLRVTFLLFTSLIDRQCMEQIFTSTLCKLNIAETSASCYTTTAETKKEVYANPAPLRWSVSPQGANNCK